ncbi:nitrate/nitrite transporter narK2 [Mycobacterium tuberculosis T17]|nr:nitrate/nitrite transporter narK2 [Mycobacterium tuberculosis T17]
MRGQAANLVLATWISVVNFWAWNLIGPLSTSYARDMSLSSAEASLLVATPILVGALGRIVTGPLTDRFGGRAMLIAVTLASILPVLAVGVAATMGSYALLVFFGLFLGVAGTIFASASRRHTGTAGAARFLHRRVGMGMVGTRSRRSSPRSLYGGSACSPPTPSSRPRSRRPPWWLWSCFVMHPTFGPTPTRCCPGSRPRHGCR